MSATNPNPLPLSPAADGTTDPNTCSEPMLIVDGHADTPQRFADEAWNFGDALGTGMLNLQAAREGGLSAGFFALWAEPLQWHGRYALRTLRLLDAVHEQVRKYPHDLKLGLSPADIVAAHKAGAFCILLGVEGGHAIENDLGLLRTYYRLGVRYMTLTWANSHEWADSSGDVDDPAVTHHGGLSGFGREVVREMNRLGMMVDVSHVSDATFWDVLKTARAPVIASHSSARALAGSPRNLTDEQLLAMATQNGIVMVNFYPAFLDDRWRDGWMATQHEREQLYAAASAPYRLQDEPVHYGVPLAVDRAFYAERLAATLPLPPLASVVDHIEHIARVAGIDHVGLGSDFDGYAIGPDGLQTAADLHALVLALKDRGFTGDRLRKILGGNLLRVFADVQSAADTG